MKELGTILLFAFLHTVGGCATAQAQTVKQDANGNYFQVDSSPRVKPSASGKTYTDKQGNVYPIYSTAKGKYFIIRTSKKTGNQYKQYLKLN